MCSISDNVCECEILQRKMARRILYCNNTLANEVALGELGLWKLAQIREMLRLGFLNKILSYSSSSWVKRVYLESRRRFEYFGEKNWCAYTYDIICEYDMEHVWEEDLFRKEFKGEMKGVLGEKIETDWREEALGKKL